MLRSRNSAAFLKTSGMKQRLPAGKDDPLNSEPLDVRELPIELFGADLLGLRALPDVAHRAPAVTSAVRIQY